MKETNFIILKENMKSMLKYSKQEYSEFKKDKNIIFLQQAGEKLFSAVENYISFINNMRIEYFQQAITLARMKEKSLVDLMYDSRELHRFFYHGMNEYDLEKAEQIYLSVLNRIEQRINKLG